MGNTLLFKYVNGQWFRSGELENNRITYAQHIWSAELPAHWIVPGLNLVIKQGNLSGRLNDIKIGAPGELLLHTIDIGMLTTPGIALILPKTKKHIGNISRPFL